jgi:hypothetical protein
MRKPFFLFVLAFLLLFVSQEIWAKQDRANYVPGELIVKFRDLSVYSDTYQAASLKEFQKEMDGRIGAGLF